MVRGSPLAALNLRRMQFVCAGLACMATLSLGCAQTARSPSTSQFDFFAEAQPEEDPWFYKVAEWQKRANRQEAETTEPALGSDSEGATLPPAQVKNSGLLRLKMGGFAAQEKRDLAKKINHWAQREARRHYRIENDQDPAQDHWPTFQELLAKNGDDCDGLDLITYGLLTEFGFPRDRVYRAIVRRQRDRGNHMVTLWFEDPKDPWVLDATGAMTFQMRRFSEIEGWMPRKVFNESEQYQVAPTQDTLVLIEN